MAKSFSLLTLNCFGGYLPNTGRRLRALARALEGRDDQVVCLQEIQLNRYLELMLESCGSHRYAAYEPYFQCPKGGLLTLARIPITNQVFIPYIERGLWYTPMLMDKMLYKGMLITTLEWEQMSLTVINTHLLANYVGDWERKGMYARLEEKQLRQLAETVQAQPADSLVMVAGDFNIPRGSRLYHDFLAHSGLEDLLAGDTRPTHRPPWGIPARYALPIDYVLVRRPLQAELQMASELCFSSKQQLYGRHHGYLSDHHGIGFRIQC